MSEQLRLAIATLADSKPEYELADLVEACRVADFTDVDLLVAMLGDLEVRSNSKVCEFSVRLSEMSPPILSDCLSYGVRQILQDSVAVNKKEEKKDKKTGKVTTRELTPEEISAAREAGLAEALAWYREGEAGQARVYKDEVTSEYIEQTIAWLVAKGRKASELRKQLKKTDDCMQAFAEYVKMFMTRKNGTEPSEEALLKVVETNWAKSIKQPVEQVLQQRKAARGYELDISEVSVVKGHERHMPSGHVATVVAHTRKH